jgi:Tfp pilus assembly protein PilE
MGPGRVKTKTISAINNVIRCALGVRKTPPEALTFIELMLVVLIIGVLAGVTLPRFGRSINNLRLNDFASRLKEQINYWHERAIVERKPVVLNIDPVSSEYWVRFSGSQERLNSYQVPSGLNMQAEQQQVVFNPDGSIDKITIKIINSDKQEINLTTQGVFGGVKVLSGE